MDETLSTDQVSDDALFASLTSASPVTEQPATVEQPTSTPVEQQPTATPAATTEQPRAETIPPGRLREEADARRNAERERDEALAELARLRANPQPHQPAPTVQPAAPKEIWDDPQAFVQQAIDPVQQAIRRQNEAISRRFAVQEFGKETVDAAYADMMQAVKTEPSARVELQRMLATDHPIGEVVAWHKNRQVLKEVGSDPAAYKNRVLEEALKDPEFQKRVIEAARSGAQPSVEAPGRPAVSQPSLRNIGTAAVAQPAAGGERSDAELFSDITRRRK